MERKNAMLPPAKTSVLLKDQNSGLNMVRKLDIDVEIRDQTRASLARLTFFNLEISWEKVQMWRNVQASRLYDSARSRCHILGW
jgi:hypothetical protein